MLWYLNFINILFLSFLLNLGFNSCSDSLIIIKLEFWFGLQPSVIMGYIRYILLLNINYRLDIKNVKEYGNGSVLSSKTRRYIYKQTNMYIINIKIALNYANILGNNKNIS